MHIKIFNYFVEIADYVIATFSYLVYLAISFPTWAVAFQERTNGSIWTAVNAAELLHSRM